MFWTILVGALSLMVGMMCGGLLAGGARADLERKVLYLKSMLSRYEGRPMSENEHNDPPRMIPAEAWTPNVRRVRKRGEACDVE